MSVSGGNMDPRLMRVPVAGGAVPGMPHQMMPGQIPEQGMMGMPTGMPQVSQQPQVPMSVQMPTMPVPGSTIPGAPVPSQVAGVPPPVPGQAPAKLISGAIVKQVLSGDSIIIRGVPRGGPPPEKQIGLAHVLAPKLGRKLPDGTMQQEDDYAWEAREYLRKRIIGKEVRFRSEYKIQMAGSSAPREFGVLYLGEENLNETLVKEGLVEVIRKNQNKDLPDVIRLKELEEEAKAIKVGKWSDAHYKAREVYQDVDDPSKLVGKTYPGIVEHVRDGSTFRVAVQLNPRKYQMITLMLSGIKCPQTSETFGEEAKFFSESRVLNQEVDVRIEQVSGGANSSSFIGSIIASGKHNLAEHLLQAGMAKCIDWSIALTASPEKLRAAERVAKNQRLRIWKDYVDPKAGKSSQVFEAKVLEIHNADALTVLNLENNEIRKVFLASIRPPKLSEDTKRPEGSTFRPLYDVPYMLEAREFLRKMLIGKRVQVKIEYVQPKTEQYQEKVGASISLADKSSESIGEALVARGLASVIRYKPDDEQRASNYDALLSAEMKAQKSKKGIHSTKQGTPRIQDLGSDSTRAKQFLPFLQRPAGSRKDAVVEFVFSASRVKLFISKENCLLNMVLAGVNAPKNQEPLAEEAMKWVKYQIQQHEVQIMVDALDKAGNYIGWLFFQSDEDKKEKNLNVELIRAGYASIREPVSNSSLLNQMKMLEAEAKNVRKGIWANYVESKGNGVAEEEYDATLESGAPTPQNGDSAAAPEVSTGPVELDLDKRKPVIVTQVAPDLSSVSVQFVDDGPSIEALLDELRKDLDAHPPLGGAFHPKKGELVAAKFSDDGLWYRGKIEKHIGGNKYQVLYVDYGNREDLQTSSLAPLSSKYQKALAAAKEYGLAYLRIPPSVEPEFVADVRKIFMNDVADKILLSKAEYRDQNTGLECVTLLEKSGNNEDVGLRLVQEGLALADRARRDRRLMRKVQQYREAEEAAKKKRLNLWRYGDFTEDDAREFGYTPSAS